MMRKFFSWFLLVVLFTMGGISFVQAQADPGDPGDDPDKVPLDPGSWILVAAGVGYGVKKWRDAKQSSTARFNSGEIMNEKPGDER